MEMVHGPISWDLHGSFVTDGGRVVHLCPWLSRACVLLSER